MSNIKKQFKEDFEQSNNVDLSFDIEQLESNTKKTKHKMSPLRLGLTISCSALATIILIPIVGIVLSSLKIDDSVKLTRRSYAPNEIRIAESNTFKKLNNISYPTNTSPILSKIDDSELSAYTNFSNSTYHSLVNNFKNDNLSYSIVGLYSTLNEMSGASSSSEVEAKLNNLLGLDEIERTAFFKKIMLANSFANNDSTIQLKNSAFFTNEYNYSQSYVNYLSELYCEAYQINFSKDASKMIDWVNKATDSNGFIDEKFLEINDESVLYYFSTLFFKNAWLNKYLSKDNITDNFYLSNGKEIKTEYMKHSYMSDGYYDYGEYISFKDYYINKNASVTYLVPKSKKDNIFDLTKDHNIFIDDNDKYVKGENNELITIHLTTPKFKNKSDIDFRPCLSELGLGDIFDYNIDSFHNAFNDEKLNSKNVFVQTLKQRNEAEFNEDGSTIKSVTVGGLGKFATAQMIFNTLDIKLDQPFIYIIKDINNLPIFVGYLDNPKS